MAGRRETLHEQTRREIKQAARQLVADTGAASLTLSEVSRRVQLSQSGMYRYFANLDALLTEIVVDGYGDFADALESSVDLTADPREQVRDVARGFRAWALGDPVAFALIFGVPVPDYTAPPGGPTVDSAARAGRLIMEVMGRAHAAGVLPDRQAGAGGPAPLDSFLTPASEPVRDWFFTMWAVVHGLVSLEVFGHLDAMGINPADVMERQLDLILGHRSR